MKHIKEAKGENGLGPIESCRKPPSMEQLSAMMKKQVTGTFTEVDRNMVDTSDIKNHVILRSRDRARTKRT